MDCTWQSFDAGRELTARRVREWLQRVGVKRLCNKPGAPWESCCVEKFNGRLREEFLGRALFLSLPGARAVLACGGWTTTSEGRTAAHSE